MFPLKSLGLVLTACIHATATRQSLSNLRDDCEFTLDGSRYDLCPLFHDRGQDGVANVHAEFIDLLYGMSFGGPPGARSREPRCPPEAPACFRDHLSASEDPESRFTQPTPIAGRFAIDTPHTVTDTYLEIDAYHGTYNELEIDLREGVGRNKPQVAHFRFICDQHARVPSLPTYVGMTARIRNFEWTTPHACAKVPLSFSALDQGEDEGDGSQDLVKPAPVYHTVRNLTIWFAVASSTILGLGCLIRYPPPQLKRWVGVAAGKLPFRVGEGILVRWAEEAMFINDEEDVMVNYEEGDDFGEQIPLKPSPIRLSARFMDYGSARR